ncbi:hypothetical protein [Streptomyces sedi]|uniref:Uncharacterized protein n=1 Tax=Streptomyces sedi TaxID=555059 RepID=A0A5C4V089_9ACTN|nr:hypothetical protein [Streptomyces sedi]TNM28519.1 hypothetical protein FH715_18395 [Streptomyces sedi]
MAERTVSERDGRVPSWRVWLAGTSGLLWGFVPFALVLNTLEESVNTVQPPNWTDWGAGVLLVAILALITFTTVERNVGLPPRGRRGPVWRGHLVGGSLGVLGACALQLGNDWLHPRMMSTDDGPLVLGTLGVVVAWGLWLANQARPGPWVPWLRGLKAETERVNRYGRRPREQPAAPFDDSPSPRPDATDSDRR